VRAREAIAAIDDAEDAARGADRLSGLLRVALPTAFGVRRIVPLLPDLLARHPQLRIDLMISDRYENLIAEGADLALRLGKQPDSSFVTRKLASARRLFVASPSYLARHHTPKRLADLAQQDLIAGPPDPGEQSWVARRGPLTETQSVNPRIRTGSGAGLVACATAGLGIAISSLWMCGEELASGALVEVLPEYRLDPIAAFVVFPSGRRPSQKARVFSDYLERAITNVEDEKANAGFSALSAVRSSDGGRTQ
jgi:DNA-binding transcriptional LysR family regulator